MVAAINAAPSLSVTNPAKVCAPGTVDLTNPAIIAGSDPGLSYTYWSDAANTIPVADPKAVGASGIYYVTAATNSGCTSTESVEVVVTVNKAAPGMRYPNGHGGTKYLRTIERKGSRTQLQLFVDATSGIELYRRKESDVQLQSTNAIYDHIDTP